MPLLPDPTKETKIETHRGIHFAMFDGKTRIPCLVSWRALNDRAVKDKADERDVKATFERHRELIERVASNNFDAGEREPIVRGDQIA